MKSSTTFTSFTTITLTLILLLCTPLLTKGQNDPEPTIESLISRLDGSIGEERLKILIELVLLCEDEHLTADTIEWGKKAQELLPDFGSPIQELKVVHSIGYAYAKSNDSVSALAPAKRAEELALELNKTDYLARTRSMLGSIHFQLMENDKALEAFSSSRELFETLGDHRSKAIALNNQALVYRSLGDSEKELELLLLSQQAFEVADDPMGVAVIGINIGNLQRNSGQSEGAEASYRRSLAMAEKAGSEKVKAGALRSLGMSANDREAPREALEYLQQALDIYLELGNSQMRIIAVYGTMGESWEILGDYPRSLEYHNLAYDMATEIGNVWMQTVAKSEISMIHSFNGDLNSAIETLVECIEVARENEFSPLLKPFLTDLNGLQAELGKYEDAYNTQQDLITFMEEMNSEENREILAEMQATFEAEEREMKIELLEKGQALQEAELENQRGLRQSILFGFAFLLVVLGLVFNRYRLSARAAVMAEAMKQEQAINVGLREIDQLKDDFLANTSHELRTPLYGMTGLVEAVLDDPEKSRLETRNMLKTVLESGHRLTGLVNDILDFSKLQKGGLVLSLEPVDIRSLVDVVLTLSKPLVADRSIEFVNTVESSFPPIMADSARVEQVLFNLVGNAIEFTQEGYIKVGAQLVGDQVKISVSDSGAGIAPEHQEKIFDYFVQADASAQREYGGTGLGLAVSRQLVELHGGNISVESVLGEGSKFSFTMPATNAEAAEIIHAVRTPLPAIYLNEPDNSDLMPSEAITSLNVTDDSPTILIVDDEVLVRQVLKQHLGSKGYRLEIASSGADALEVLGSKAIDLVLLDIMMPKMSGFEVCREIRKTKHRNDLPVIFLSAMGRQEDRVASFDEGGNDYLTKPIGRIELLARVAVHLELLAGHREQFEEIHELRRILPICSYCKKIREDDGYWSLLENYISQHSEAEFTHGICPSCISENFPEFEKPV
ncbi:MAG: response regulator [bacterium]|nr:response regulator [bacterium]